MHFPSHDGFTGFMAAIKAAHQRELVTLAARADELALRATQGGPWTATPGRDALAELHPELPAPADPARPGRVRTTQSPTQSTTAPATQDANPVRAS